METIVEIKEFIAENREKGCECPGCEQFVKVYHYNFNDAMARVLIDLYKYNQDHANEYVHVNRLLVALGKQPHNNFTKTQYWGLIEGKPERRDDDSPRTGFWRITQKGISFVDGDITVQRKVSLFNQKAEGFDGDQITIQDALGTKFNYRDLMAGL